MNKFRYPPFEDSLPATATPKEGEMHEDRSKEILNYNTAMTRDIGEFRAETKSRFERLETEMRIGFAEVRKDVRRLPHKFKVVVEELTKLKIESRDLRKRVEVVEAKIGITDDV